MSSVPHFDDVITRALDEDLAYGPDATTLATVPVKHRSTAHLCAREGGVIAGIDIVAATIQAVAARFNVADAPDAPVCVVDIHATDGTVVSAGDVVATITAPTQILLTAERTFLNLVCHLSGIATHTRAWSQALAATGQARIRDTRKTLPGLRELQKYAVVQGGGVNHRMGLGDAALIKDNHIVAAGSVTKAYELVVSAYPDLPVEVEVDTLSQLRQVLELKPALVLLDNFSVEETRDAVALRDELSPATKLESSGGLSLEDAHSYGATGVDYLAVGALTHSVKVLDLGLDM